MSVLSLLPEDKKKELRIATETGTTRVKPRGAASHEINRKESLESVYSSNSRLNLLNKRKRLNPLGDMSQPSVRSKSGDRYVTQRVLSAKTHRVKQLQNQLSDAHYHLQELSNENRVLRVIQKKQEIALQRYENSNAELPQVLNSHTEEIRIQQTKFKQLKGQFKEVTQKLKERDMQLQMLKDEHQHLLELSKDRNLLEREKLQAQNSELSLKVQQQNETITMLQRRLALEAKNFKHQLQNEINRHKDTRADLDLAINNADKLSTIIEMKEKMISTAASRSVKSPTKISFPVPRPLSKSKSAQDTSGRSSDERHNADQNLIAKICESSRNLSSALSHDEDTSSSIEPRSRYARSRTNSTSTRSTPVRKSSKGSDDIVELAKTVQEGMADLAIFDDKVDFNNTSSDEVQKKIEIMKADLMHKIKNNEDDKPRKTSALRRKSTEESIEEQILESDEVDERPKSRGRRNSSVSFYDNVIEETTATVTIHDYKKPDETHATKLHRENSVITKLQKENSVISIAERKSSATERKLSSGKPIDKYCKDIIQDIEKSSKVIDKHVKQFQNSRFDNDQIVQQLQAVDKINELVSSKVEIPNEALTELNNNFKMLTDQVFNEAPIARKRSISGRRNSRELRSNLLDVGMSNQDMLDELLGKK